MKNERTLTQRYGDVVTDLALKRKGIIADTIEDLTEQNWEVLIENANGDHIFARLAVVGFFDQVGTEYLEEQNY